MGSVNPATQPSHTTFIKMTWRWSLVVLLLMISRAQLQPVEEKSDDMEELLDSLFRQGRDFDTNEVDEVDGDDDNETITEEAVVDPEEVSKYNTYMDAVYKRMNAALIAKLMDPMELNLDSKKVQKRKKESPRSGKKTVKSDDAVRDKRSVNNDVDEDEEVELNDEDTQRKSRKDTMKKKNNKKKNKDQSKKDKLQKKKQKAEKKKEKEEKKKLKELKKSKKIERRQKKKSKENKRVSRDVEEGDENISDVVKDTEENIGDTDANNDMTKRKVKDNSKKKAKEQRKKKKNKNKRKKNKKKDKKIKKKPNQEQKENGNQRGARSMKMSKESNKSVKVRGSLSGIATLRRTEDVNIVPGDGFNIITSEFSVGPLQLEVTKSLKEDQERSVRSAKATTDIMTGEMILKVKPDGSARVQKLGFKRPGNVSVEGRVTDKAERAESFLKRSFNKSKGLAAAKILKMARFVLNNKN